MILYVRNSLHPLLVKKEVISKVDVVFVEIRNNSSKLILGLIYRPPGQPTAKDNLLFDQVSEICCNFETVIMGDFNLPVTRWGDALNSHMGQDLYSNLLESALHQHVLKPTRERNIFDLVLSTKESLVNDVNVGLEFSSSDHRLITYNIKIKDDVRPSTLKVPDYRREKSAKLQNLLANSGWSAISTASDISKSWKVSLEP